MIREKLEVLSKFFASVFTDNNIVTEIKDSKIIHKTKLVAKPSV